MRSRALGLVAAALGFLGCLLASEAQPAGKPARIGYLSGGVPTAEGPLLDEFRHGLRQLGYSEGTTVTLEPRWAEGRLEKLPHLATQLVASNPDVLFTRGTPAAVAARQATATVPIVAITGNPVESGLVGSLARPGGNLTGLTIFGELDVKRLELLKEATRTASRVALLWNPLNSGAHPGLKKLQAAAPKVGVTLHLGEVKQPEDFGPAFAAIRAGNAQALMTLPDTLIHAHRRRIIEFAAEARLPAIYPEREYVDAGGLMAYGPSLRDLYRRAAGYVDKILRGAKPADLPIEQASKFELVVNLKTAKALGLHIPQSVLLRADQVIQ